MCQKKAKQEAKDNLGSLETRLKCVNSPLTRPSFSGLIAHGEVDSGQRK